MDLIVKWSSIVRNDRQWLFICIETCSTWIRIVDKDFLIVCYTRHLIRDPFQCCHVHSVPRRYASGQFRNGTSGCTSTNTISSCRGTSLLRKITKCPLRRSFSCTVNWSRGAVHCHDFECTTRFSSFITATCLPSKLLCRVASRNSIISKDLRSGLRNFRK